MHVHMYRFVRNEIIYLGLFSALSCAIHVHVYQI